MRERTVGPQGNEELPEPLEVFWQTRRYKSEALPSLAAQKNHLRRFQNPSVHAMLQSAEVRLSYSIFCQNIQVIPKEGQGSKLHSRPWYRGGAGLGGEGTGGPPSRNYSLSGFQFD